jgi:hypothetical protein
LGRQQERIADHATNIAEMVVCLSEGKIIRHTDLEDRPPSLSGGPGGTSGMIVQQGANTRVPGDAMTDVTGGGGEKRQPPNAHLRNLTAGEQIRVARSGSQQDRMALERIYGKAVWEALLQNPGITVGEVSRIAQKGALPKSLIELIVSNGSWLANNAVRRGLLQNHRLGRDLVAKVLRAMPKHELKLVEKQSIYSSVVREMAKKISVGGR